MERYRQADLPRLSRQSVNARNDPDRRDRDRSCSHAHDFYETAQRLTYPVVVGERFAHAHEDDVRHSAGAALDSFLTEECVGVSDLSHDLAWCQMAIEAELARCAERASERTSGLR